MVDCGFDSALFGFLADLAANNSTPWFQAHRQGFEDEVRTPMLGFILAFAEPLAAISPYFEANPARSGGSMFRINRDIRFTPDKRPYKTHVGAQFRHPDSLGIFSSLCRQQAPLVHFLAEALDLAW